MAGKTNREVSWKKHHTKENSLKMERLFGIIKNPHHKPSSSNPATISSSYRTTKTFEDYQIEFELQKSKVIAHFRLQNRLI